MLDVSQGARLRKRLIWLLEDLDQEDLLHLLLMSELMPGRFESAAVQNVLQLDEHVTIRTLQKMEKASLLLDVHDSSTKQRPDADGWTLPYCIVPVVRELLK